MKNDNYKNLNLESGVSLIITFFIMMIILAVVLSISILLYSEIKVIKNIGDSMVSLYAADSGIEKILFYDKQVLATFEDGTTAPRGLCSLPDVCKPGGDSSIYCNSATATELASGGCDLDKCNNCQVSFSSSFNNRSYEAVAKVYPSVAGRNAGFEIKSTGSYGGAGRAIKILMSGINKPAGPIIMQGGCAVPVTSARGEYESIEISVEVGVSSPESDAIDSVTATIYDKDGVAVSNPVELPLALATEIDTTTFGTWKYNWTENINSQTQAYYVKLRAQDILGNQKICNIYYFGCSLSCE